MLKKHLLLAASILTIIGLSGCGGGSSDNNTSTFPLPTLSLLASVESTEINSEFSLSWSTTNANSCSASGDWSGVKSISGNETITEAEAGNKTYTLSCSGEGGEISLSVEVEITNEINNGLWDHTNVVYGMDEPSRQWLNIRLADDQTKPSPIYLFAHANGGTAYSISEKQLNAITSEGYSIISWESIPTINADEDPAIGFADAQVMFDWVIANAETYNLDPEHIIIGGRSRGSVISWQLAHSNHPSIKGIYMYNALPQGAWQNTEIWNPVNEITVDSPLTYLVYGPDFDDDDGHNPSYVDPIIEQYDTLGIGDKITRYVDMWGDFQDSDGHWTNDGQIMHYFPEFVAKLNETDIPLTTGYNTLFMGHSFFSPIARQMSFHMAQLGVNDHSQYIEFSPGTTGTPSALWEDEEHRNNVQAVLNSGTIEVFGMTVDRDIESYVLWIDYALSKNSDTKIVLGSPWLDFPANYNSAAQYENVSIGLQNAALNQIDILKSLYPDNEIIFIPYGFAATQLRHLFESGQLPGVTDLIGNNLVTSIFADQKGHGHGGGFLLDLSEFIWLIAIYNINLDNYDYSAGHSVNLKEVANTIIEEYANYFD